MPNNTTPKWVLDTPDLLAICHVTLDRLDAHPRDARKYDVSFPVSKHRFPSLFVPECSEDAEWTWQALCEGERVGLWVLRSTRKKRHSEMQPWQFRRLVILENAESILRLWLKKKSISTSSSRPLDKICCCLFP